MTTLVTPAMTTASTHDNYDYDTSLTKVNLKEIPELNPFNSIVWNTLTTPITKEEVQKCIDDRQFLELPYRYTPRGITWNRNAHARRIAYFVVYIEYPHDEDDPYPILYQSVCHETNYLYDWPIRDGNHRLAAAFFRGDVSVGISHFDYSCTM